LSLIIHFLKAPLEESSAAKPAAAAVDNHLILMGHSDEIGGATGRMARRTVFNGDNNPANTTNLDMMNGNVHDDNDNTSSVPTSPKALQFLLRDDLFGHFMQANQVCHLKKCSLLYFLIFINFHNLLRRLLGSTMAAHSSSILSNESGRSQQSLGNLSAIGN
jgi:hypothetical protein